MSINKTIVYLFAMAISVTLSAMELQNSQELTTSQSRQSPGLMQYVGSCLSSSYNTVNNYLSDEAAFIKLGWPPSNIDAQKELKDTLIIYQKVNNAVQNNLFYQEFENDYITINNRQGYCQRVLKALSKHPQAVELALFCLKHHKPAMNFFDLTRFGTFVKKELEKSQKVGAEFSKLTILPEETNQLLDQLYEQTLVVKNHSKDVGQQKEEEEKKKKEQEELKKKEEERKKKEQEEADRLEKEDKKKKEKEEEDKKKLEEERKRKEEENKKEQKKNGKK